MPFDPITWVVAAVCTGAFGRMGEWMVDGARRTFPEDGSSASDASGRSPFGGLSRGKSLSSVIADLPDAHRSRPPLYIVLGGCDKYDPKRVLDGRMKEYQSTDPVTGVVRLSRVLDHNIGPRFLDAVCDYSTVFEDRDRSDMILLLVGGGDTNRRTAEIFSAATGSLPAAFRDAHDSSQIQLGAGGQSWTGDDCGLILAIERVAVAVPYVVLCAGNSAKGTNAALFYLASWLASPGTHPTIDEPAAVVRANDAGAPTLLWPNIAP